MELPLSHFSRLFHATPHHATRRVSSFSCFYFRFHSRARLSHHTPLYNTCVIHVMASSSCVPHHPSRNSCSFVPLSFPLSLSPALSLSFSLRLSSVCLSCCRFQEESEPGEYVERLAEQMLPSARFADAHILKGPYVMDKWDPALLQASAINVWEIGRAGDALLSPVHVAIRMECCCVLLCFFPYYFCLSLPTILRGLEQPRCDKAENLKPQAESCHAAAAARSFLQLPL